MNSLVSYNVQPAVGIVLIARDACLDVCVVKASPLSGGFTSRGEEGDLELWVVDEARLAIPEVATIRINLRFELK
jgi:hypothetical protein